MGKKKGKKDQQTPNAVIQQGVTLREENTGKKHVNASSALKIHHLQKLSKWAGGTAGVPPLAALFGHRLAAHAEDAGVPLNPSCFLCQRCETMLQPGFNCTIRVEKNVKHVRRRKKSGIPSKNKIVFTCHFCSHRNIQRGTPKGYVRALLDSMPSSASDSKTKCPAADASGNSNEKVAEDTLRTVVEKSPEATTPMEKSLTTSTKKRKACKSPLSERLARGKSSKLESGKGTGGSSKRRRKFWSSLKEIAESNELQRTRSLSDFAIPFHL